jgi:predicted permease
MNGRRVPRVLSWLAARLVRGPEAPFVLTDLDDCHDRDLTRGLPPWRARGRYAFNLIASALSLQAERLRPSGLRPSWVDVKLGLRMLVRYPVLTTVAVLTLAIGIPVGVAPAHLVDALEAPLPVDEADRVRLIRYWNVETIRTSPTSVADFHRWRDTLTSFRSLGAFRMTSYNFDPGTGQVVSVRGAEVSASTFAVLRVQPLLGRPFAAGDDRAGAAPVAIIGHDLWRVHFGSDPAAVGRTIRLGGEPYSVVGVMPAGFEFPAVQQIWLPLPDGSTGNPPSDRPVAVFGRLADDTSPESAEAELVVAGRDLAMAGATARERVMPEIVPTAFLLMGGLPKSGFRGLPEYPLIRLLTLIPLLVACANIGLLIFARTATRSSEFAVRTALGASRARILTQVFTEALVLAVLAAGVGLLVVRAAMDALVMRGMAAAGETLPYWVDFSLTQATVVRAMALAVLSAAIAGVVPAWRVTGRSVHQNIQRARAHRSGVRFGGLSSALLVVDVAIAVAAVSFGIGLAEQARATMENGEAAVGIEASQYLSAEIRLPGATAATGATSSDLVVLRTRLASTQRALLDRLQAEPGVRAVAIASALPRMDHPIQLVELDDEELAPGARGHRVRTALVDVGFFEALRHPILAGRSFNAADVADGASSVIVNTSFSDRLLGGANPIGRRVRYVSRGSGSRSGWYEIVGVVGHLGMHVLTPDHDEGIYHPAPPGAIHPVRLAIEVGDHPEQFTPRLRAIVADVEPHGVVVEPVALDRVYEGDSYLIAAIALGCMLLVGILLTLAASGIYAIMSFTVAERTREIGIRVALGADRARIAAHIVRRAILQLAIGAALGMPVAGRIFFELQEDAGHPSAILAMLMALGTGAGAMVLVGLVACVAPTLRALRITPVEAVKVEG